MSEEARGKNLLLRYDGKRCIHSRHCVLDAPDVFLANVKGPWIHPDAIAPKILWRSRTTGEFFGDRRARDAREQIARKSRR